uniref:Complement component C8 beta chain n=1 Tax=Anolis carolinensis TaxID=28377 RepID=A0A803SQ81_ANOCA|nr:PREDICTED: complement component C8 beta chain isoform X1 [Anolis carolinensis]|eukprot:XP_003220222.1 PREDICTED: complement component C8 beta chain isoform X1 [Anolis carolinensis]
MFAIDYPHCFKTMSETSLLSLLCPARLFLIYGIISSLNLHCSSGEVELSFQLNGADVNVAKERWRRSPNNPPEQIDCTLSSWSSWSMCDPCQKKRYRFSRVEQPSQFGGDRCDYADKETEDCVASRPCRNTVRCEGFVCETGRCIHRRLLCNGDNDCGDQSDEKNCKKVFKRCSQPIEQYWGIQMLASGLNIFTNHLEGLVLDHKYYAGACSPQNIAGTNFRKPFNVESYLAETKGTYEFTSTEYESYSSFEHSVDSAKSKQESFSVGLKIPGVFHFGYSQDDTRYKRFVQRTKRFSSTSSKFIHARSDLEIAQYKLKKQNPMLHYEFFQRVLQLPLEYSYGEYRELFRDYGTHYITEATLGGIYEFTLIMNSDALQKAGYSLSDVRSCTQAGLNLGANIEGVYVSLGISGGACNALLKEIGDNTSEKKFVEDFIALVRGGASEYIATLAAKELPTPELMQKWGDAVQYNPEIIQMKVEPLYELVTSATFANANTLKQNMRRALEEFQQESSSCRCTPCQGNGRPFLKGTHCECICPLGHRGLACEETLRTGTAIDGNWSCWSSWSPASGGKQTRTRECNNPSAQNGGKQCPGLNIERI